MDHKRRVWFLSSRRGCATPPSAARISLGVDWRNADLRFCQSRIARHTSEPAG